MADDIYRKLADDISNDKTSWRGRPTGKAPELGMPYSGAPHHETTVASRGGHYIFATGDKDFIPADCDRRFLPLDSNPHEVQAAFVGDVPLCPDCLEFGTICRPCRKARYDAAQAARVAVERAENYTRMRVAPLVLGVVLALGFAVQSCAEKRCGATARWDAEAMACYPRF